MANTYIQIGSTATAGAGGAASFDFTSIPATYTDLVVVMSLRSTALTDLGTIGINLSFNGSTSNRNQIRIFGAGTTVGSDNATSAGIRATLPTSTSTASTFGSLSVYFPNYAGSANKSFSVDSVAENNSATSNELDMTAGLWSITSAITSLSFSPSSGNFVQYSTASLYGISKS